MINSWGGSEFSFTKFWWLRSFFFAKNHKKKSSLCYLDVISVMVRSVFFTQIFIYLIFFCQIKDLCRVSSVYRLADGHQSVFSFIYSFDFYFIFFFVGRWLFGRRCCTTMRFNLNVSPFSFTNFLLLFSNLWIESSGVTHTPVIYLILFAPRICILFFYDCLYFFFFYSMCR